MSKNVLYWKKFNRFREARKAFRNTPCIYGITDKNEKCFLKIGESKDLWRRYFGGTGYTVDAAMRGSGNLVFVAKAPVSRTARKLIQDHLILKHQPIFCAQGRRTRPLKHVKIEHRGVRPKVIVKFNP